MCSTPEQRIAEIGQAIDELAAQALAASTSRSARCSPAPPGGTAGLSDADQVAIRLAELWAQLAALDPEVARRLPTYQAE